MAPSIPFQGSGSIDALPYFDKEVDIPGLKDLARSEIDKELALLKRELQSSSSSSSAAAADVAGEVERYLVENGRMPEEVEMFSRSKPLSDLLALQSNPTENPLSSTSLHPAIDPALYTLPNLDDEDLEYEVKEEDWRELESKVRVGLGHMEVRNANAALQSSFAPNHWLIRNFQLEGEAKELESEVEIWKEKVMEINRERRLFQESTGKHLSALESRWQDLVTSTIQLEMANKALGGEVVGLRAKAAQLEADLEAR